MKSVRRKALRMNTLLSGIENRYPRLIEKTPTKLSVNIQSNNEIKHNVACYRSIFINHNIVHNKTKSEQNQFCRNKQEAITSQ